MSGEGAAHATKSRTGATRHWENGDDGDHRVVHVVTWPGSGNNRMSKGKGNGHGKGGKKGIKQERGGKGGKKGKGKKGKQ